MNRQILIIALLSTLVFTGSVNAALAGNPNPASVSNAIIDVGQNSIVNSIITGGLRGYTSNTFWIAPNDMSGGAKSGNAVPFTVGNTFPVNNIFFTFSPLSSNQVSLNEGGTQNTLIAVNILNTVTTNNALGVWTFNTLTIDSNGLGTNTLKMTASSITVNPLLVAGTPTESNSIIDVGQGTTQTANPSGGTPAYSYIWHTNFGVTVDCASNGNVISGATSSTYFASPTATNSYAYQLTDSASTHVVKCSAGDTTTVDPALVSSGFTSSNNPIQLNMFQVLKGTVTGGASTYTYNFLIYNSVSFITNMLIVGNSVTSNAFTFPQIFSYMGGTMTANILVTDSATTPTSVTNTLTYTVGTTAPVISVTDNPLVFGYRDVISGYSTGNYYNDPISLTINGIQVVAKSANSFTYNFFNFTPPAMGDYNIQVKDVLTNSVVLSVIPTYLFTSPLSNTIASNAVQSTVTSSAGGGSSYNSVYDHLILSYFPYNNLFAGGNVVISTNTVTAIAGSNYNSLYYTGTNYNSLYLTNVYSQNGVWNSINGQTVTLGTIAGTGITNSLNLGATGYNSVYDAKPSSTYNSVYNAYTNYNSVYDHLILSYFPYNNLFGGTGISTSNGNTIASTVTNYNSLYLTNIYTQNGIWNTISGQTITLGAIAGTGITNTLNIGATGYNSMYWTGTNYNSLYAVQGFAYNSAYYTGTNYNAVYDNILLNYFPYNNLNAGGNVMITMNTITAIAGSGGGGSTSAYYIFLKSLGQP